MGWRVEEAVLFHKDDGMRRLLKAGLPLAQEALLGSGVQPLQKGASLNWWKEMISSGDVSTSLQSSLRTFADCAKMLLAICAGEGPAESIFNISGDLVTKKRNRLDPKNVEMCVVCNAFLNSPLYVGKKGGPQPEYKFEDLFEMTKRNAQGNTQ